MNNMNQINGSAYEFTNHWFADNQTTWDGLMSQLPAQKILEIGSYEGQATCYWIARCGAARSLEMHCVDTWQGGVEHQLGASAEAVMSAVEQRFLANTKYAMAHSNYPIELHIHKELSSQVLPRLLCQAQHRQSFDLIYIDGSHLARDVLTDAVFAFQLLKVGGLMVFDDYLWHEEASGQQDLLNMPKMAIDAFVNVFQRQFKPVFGLPNNQVYLQKIGA
jgi:Methyltransferase domain